MCPSFWTFHVGLRLKSRICSFCENSGLILHSFPLFPDFLGNSEMEDGGSKMRGKMTSFKVI